MNSCSLQHDRAQTPLVLLLLVMQSGHLALAKQHYRRAMQKAPEACPPRVYLRLGSCFMASGAAVVAAEVYSSCLESCSSPPSAAADSVNAAGELFADAAAVEVGGRCATTWMGLGVAYLRLGEYR
jgi:Tfp pilus assembly protein PilF